MRLTKRQLKRIIREEYSRLKRRGLLREMGEMDGQEDEILADAVHQYGQDLIAAAQSLCYQSMQDGSAFGDAREFGSMVLNGIDENVWNWMCANDPETRDICQAIKDECKTMMGIPTGASHSQLGPNDADVWFAIEGSGIAEAMEEACFAEIGG